MALRLRHVDVLLCKTVGVVVLGIPADSLGRAHTVQPFDYVDCTVVIFCI
jgi:hypothetical protein